MPNDPIINEDADRKLGKIILRYGGGSFLLLLLATFAMPFVNVPRSPLFSMRHFLDMLSILVVLTPFFLGISRLFGARLKIGRELVNNRRWQESIAALDPFAGAGQRFLDTTGEAHYLLSRAYRAVGEQAKADAARAFVLRHRPGVWADTVRKETLPVQENRPRPANGKRRRRF